MDVLFKNGCVHIYHQLITKSRIVAGEFVIVLLCCAEIFVNELLALLLVIARVVLHCRAINQFGIRSLPNFKSSHYPF